MHLHSFCLTFSATLQHVGPVLTCQTMHGHMLPQTPLVFHYLERSVSPSSFVKLWHWRTFFIEHHRVQTVSQHLIKGLICTHCLALAAAYIFFHAWPTNHRGFSSWKMDRKTLGGRQRWKTIWEIQAMSRSYLQCVRTKTQTGSELQHGALRFEDEILHNYVSKNFWSCVWAWFSLPLCYAGVAMYLNCVVSPDSYLHYLIISVNYHIYEALWTTSSQIQNSSVSFKKYPGLTL